VLLEQHAGHFSPEFEALTLANSGSIIEKLGWRYKTAWVRRSIRIASALVVQTQALADRIARIGLRRDNVFVVPHGPGQVGYGSVRSVAVGPNRLWRIGYISKFGVQKDFATLFRAAKILLQRHKLALVLTLDPAYGPSADVLHTCEDLGIGNIVENHGEVGQEVQNLYDGLDVMVFCSTCESFGFPMVEAMARGIPIIVADTPENREIVGPAGLRFRPHDENDLAAQLTRIVENSAEFKRQSELSLARAHDFSWQAAARGTLSVIERTFGNKAANVNARQTQ
jgi:glycosyltransferase involved in cell wall biosynthesis